MSDWADEMAADVLRDASQLEAKMLPHMIAGGLRKAVATQTAELVSAAWQVLDDMGEHGHTCAPAAKAMLRHAYEPFASVDDELDMPIEEATRILDGVGWLP